MSNGSAKPLSRSGFVLILGELDVANRDEDGLGFGDIPGRVVDRADAPVAGAVVCMGRHHSVTGEGGRFSLDVDDADGI